MATCDICGSKAVFQENGKTFCGPHFSNWYEETVADTITRYQMIPDGSKIAVGLSGGKDSTVLLSVLTKLDLNAEFIAITVDEGISCYRDETIYAAKKLVSKLNVQHEIISFHELCGKNLDELLEKNPERACSVCGTLRRRALNTGARKFSADKIATGHCLDDEAQSVLMNYLRGDVTRVTESYATNAGELFIPRIKPLFHLSERATVAYGLVNHLLSTLPECPYTKYALRADVRSELGRIEYKYPGTMLNIVLGQEKFLTKLGSFEKNKILMNVCEHCGEPTTHRLCAACTLLERI